MKKVFIMFSSEDEYRKVGKGNSSGPRRSLLGKCPKWDFKLEAEFEGVVVNRRQQKGDAANYMVYEVVHWRTKKPYVFFGSSVLDEKMEDIKDFSKIKVNFHGKPTGKKYYLYEVFVVDSYKFDPAHFPDIDFTGERVDPVDNYAPPAVNEAAAVAAPTKNFVKKIESSTEKKESPTTTATSYDDPPF